MPVLYIHTMHFDHGIDHGSHYSFCGYLPVLSNMRGVQLIKNVPQALLS